MLFHLMANCDPRRDTVIADGPVDILDHASPHLGVGSKIAFDATRKIAGEGAIRKWPAELSFDDATQRLVDRRWREYGL